MDSSPRGFPPLTSYSRAPAAVSSRDAAGGSSNASIGASPERRSDPGTAGVMSPLKARKTASAFDSPVTRKAIRRADRSVGSVIVTRSTCGSRPGGPDAALVAPPERDAAPVGPELRGLLVRPADLRAARQDDRAPGRGLLGDHVLERAHGIVEDAYAGLSRHCARAPSNVPSPR